MAQKVFEIKKALDGGKTVLLEGGWVPYRLLTRPLETEVRSRMTDEQKREWDHGDAYMHLVFFGGGPAEDKNPFDGDRFDGDDDDDGDAQREADDSGDGQDESEGDGSGSGDGDKPVMHSEFDPWGKKVHERMLAQGEVIRILDGIVGEQTTRMDFASQEVKGIQRTVNDLAKKVSEGNMGGDGGGIRKIILITPKVPEGKELGGDELYHNMFPRLLKNVGAGCHVYLPGPPGSGKSHAAAQVARALDWRFGSISLGPTTTESRLWGGMTANGEFFEPPFVELARHAAENTDSGSVFCLDEMDNGNAGIIATMNSALANGSFTAPNGDNIQWGSNFVIVAGANTFGTGPTAEFAGRNKLDAATLDRFNYLPWDTDYTMERTIVEGTLWETPALAADWLDVWHSARKNVEAHGLKVFITMRGAARGAKMLAHGDSMHDVLNEVLLFKLPKEQAEKVNPL